MGGISLSFDFEARPVYSVAAEPHSGQHLFGSDGEVARVAASTAMQAGKVRQNYPSPTASFCASSMPRKEEDWQW